MSNWLIISNRQIEEAEYFKDPEELEYCLSKRSTITHLLFAFWSWRVPKHILDKYKCYGMHTGFMLDKKGLGGSPIDNLQKLNIKWAALNVFEMTEVIDGGRVRLAIPISLDGSKDRIIWQIDQLIPPIVEFLKQDISMVPERFRRII